MHFLRRAALAVIRKKGRSAILFLVFAAIANLVLAGLAIQHATDSAKALARQKLGGQLVFSFNMQQALQQARANGEERPMIRREPVTEEMVKTISGLPHITGYNCIVNASGVAEGFKAVVTENSQQESAADRTPTPMFWRNDGSAETVMPDVNVTGTASSQLLDAFSNGDATLIAGRAITPSDAGKGVALVEQNLAEQNGLKVGDRIKVKAPRAGNTVDYTIVGIYRAGNGSTAGEGEWRGLPFTEPYNRIIVDYKSAIPLKSVTGDDAAQSGGIDQAVFYVDDPKNIDQVLTAAKSLKIDWNKFTLDANNRAFQQMIGPIENVAAFSKTAVYIVAIAGAVILALILMLSLRERAYETGVLLAMGESRLKIIAQYVAEVLLIAILAFGLSVYSGRLIARDIGNRLLEREIQVAQNQTELGFPGNGGSFPGIRSGWIRRQMPGSYQPIDTIDVRVTAGEVERLFATGLLVLVAGTIVPAASVMRYNPKTILTRTG